METLSSRFPTRLWIVEEVTNVLRDKFGWTDEAIKLAQRIADFTEKVHPQRAIDVANEDPVRQPNSRVQRLESLSLSSREMHTCRHVGHRYSYSALLVVARRAFHS
jgi:hypothetical protein